jgi:hypothetical protein
MSIRQQIRSAMAAGHQTYEDIATAARVPIEKVKNNMGPLTAEGKVKNVGERMYAIANWPADSLIHRATVLDVPKDLHARAEITAAREEVEDKAPQDVRTKQGAHFTISHSGRIVVAKGGQLVELAHAEVAVLQEFLINTCPVWDPQ